MPRQERQKLVMLATARDEVELAIWLGLLELEGVPVAVHKRDPLGGLDVAPTPIFSYDIYVQAEDEGRAREVLGLQGPD